MDAPPKVVPRKVASNLIAGLFRVSTWALYGRKYNAPIRPDQLLWLDPHRLEHKLSNKPQTPPVPPTHILSGPWDRQLESIRDDVVFTSFYQHFVENRPWIETKYVEFLGGDVSEHGTLSTEEALVRCRTMDRLYEYIGENGYLRQDELERRGELLIGGTTPLLPPAYREIAVNITRDGEFLWHAGFHRLVIAQLLDIEAIPVRVHIRHTAWQNTRERIYTQETHPRDLDHPDLEDLV